MKKDNYNDFKAGLDSGKGMTSGSRYEPRKEKQRKRMPTAGEVPYKDLPVHPFR